VSSGLAKRSAVRLRQYGRLCTHAGVAAVLRVLVGAVFVFAGFSKVLLPHAEVVAHIQQYHLVPDRLVPAVAAGLPWLEIGSGTALLIGFGTTLAAWVIGAQLVAFSVLMVLVLVAGIPIEDCGCFGNLGLPETPLQVLARDLVMLALLVPVLYRRGDVMGLDAWGDTAASP